MKQAYAARLIFCQGGQGNFIDNGEKITVVGPDFTLNGYVVIQSCKGILVSVEEKTSVNYVDQEPTANNVLDGEQV